MTENVAPGRVDNVTPIPLKRESRHAADKQANTIAGDPLNYRNPHAEDIPSIEGEAQPVDRNASAQQGIIWVIASSDHSDLICIRHAENISVSNFDFDAFNSALNLGDSAQLRYYALVDDVASAAHHVQEFLFEQRVSDEIFLSHPALAATVVETCGVQVYSRRSLFERSDLPEAPNGSHNISQRVKKEQRARDREEIDTLVAEAESRLDDVDALLSTSLFSDAVGEVAPVGQPSVSSDLAAAFKKLQQKQTETVVHDRIEPAETHPLQNDTTLNERSTFRPHRRSPIRKHLSDKEQVAMENWILHREASTRVRDLTDLLVRSLTNMSVVGAIAGAGAVLLFNLPSRADVLIQTIGGGLICFAAIALLWFLWTHSGQLLRWHRIKRMTRKAGMHVPNLSEARSKSRGVQASI